MEEDGFEDEDGSGAAEDGQRLSGKKRVQTAANGGAQKALFHADPVFRRFRVNTAERHLAEIRVKRGCCW